MTRPDQLILFVRAIEDEVTQNGEFILVNRYRTNGFIGKLAMVNLGESGGVSKFSIFD